MNCPNYVISYHILPKFFMDIRNHEVKSKNAKRLLFKKNTTYEVIVINKFEKLHKYE